MCNVNNRTSDSMATDTASFTRMPVTLKKSEGVRESMERENENFRNIYFFSAAGQIDP